MKNYKIYLNYICEFHNRLIYIYATLYIMSIILYSLRGNDLSIYGYFRITLFSIILIMIGFTVLALLLYFLYIIFTRGMVKLWSYDTIGKKKVSDNVLAILDETLKRRK